jgi:Helicase associated domain
MNQSNNTFHYAAPGHSMCFNGYFPGKKAFTKQPESLFSMALFETMVRQHETLAAAAAAAPAAPAFYPVDEYKDLSLKEILDISDDFLFADEDPLMTANVHDTSAVTNHHHHHHQPDGAPTTTLHYQIAAHARPVDKFVEPVQVNSANCYRPIPSAVADAACIMSKKRTREESFEQDDDDDEDEEGRRFRPYQAGQWTEKFDELCMYRQRFGHCLVPHTYKENLPLARWVKRQRYQYKLMLEGKPSTMTEDRVKALEEIGFVWDSQGTAWEERLMELRDFRNAFQHCNVPSNYSENKCLSTWVKCQRRQMKLFREGKPSNMTPERVEKLESLGFEWELRSYRKTGN